MTAKKVKKSLTIHITQEDRDKLEDAVKHSGRELAK